MPFPAPPRAGAPPGPPAWGPGGHLAAFRRDRLAFLAEAARHGDVAAIRFGPLPAWLLSHPAHVEQVLVTEEGKFCKDRFTRDLGAALGDGLLTADGEAWRTHRRMVQPAFHRARMAGYGEVMAGRAAEACAAWPPGVARDVHQDMLRLTLDIAARTLFGTDLAAHAGEVEAALETILRHFRAREDALVPLPRWVPTADHVAFREAVASLDRVVHGMIARRRAEGPGAGDDLLAMLLEARYEDATPMPDLQVRDEVVTILLAGHETTAIALSWAWWLLGQHPEAEAALHAELDAVLGGRLPGAADLHRLPFTEGVVKEALRLYPPAWLLGREALEPVLLGSHVAPPGMQVLLSPWVVHRDPRWWPAPEEFRPARWRDPDPAQARRPRFAYFPFGGGPRTCVGSGFAMMETVLVLATIAQRWRLRPAPGAPAPVPWPSVTLRPQGGVQVVPELREPAPQATPPPAADLALLRGGGPGAGG